MADEPNISREELLKELLALQASPQVNDLAKQIIEANKSFDDELDRCLKVDPCVLQRIVSV